MTAERADDHAPAGHRLPERSRFGRVGQQFVRVAVSVTRVVAGTELHSLDPELGKFVERLLERQILVQNRQNSEFHAGSSSSFWFAGSFTSHQRRSTADC